MNSRNSIVKPAFELSNTFARDFAMCESAIHEASGISSQAEQPAKSANFTRPVKFSEARRSG